MTRPLLYETLKVLMRDPIVILVKGAWRSGKTDTSLLMGHVAKKWRLIDKIGANIWTFKNPEVEYIISLGHLKRWLHADKSRKLFIFDEGLKHVYRRSAMSQKNVAIVKILAELSKGHGRMIFCSQTDKIDSDILDPVFCRAMWEKYSKKVMRATSLHHPPRTFRNLPRSPIRFDPDRLAPFIDKDLSKDFTEKETDLTYKVCKRYYDGESMTAIEGDSDMHREEIRRHIKKGLGLFLAHYDEIKEHQEAT